MTLLDLKKYFDSILKPENFSSDIAKNGIQIDNSEPENKQIKKVAFAVDASLETVKKAGELKADVLFTHHGLFWGGCDTITGIHGSRIREFIKNDIALISYHIPLDANEEIGNNFGMAKKLGDNFEVSETFGHWRGMVLGVAGTLKNPLSVREIGRQIFGKEFENFEKLQNGQIPSDIKSNSIKLLESGNSIVRKVGIISGGSGEDFSEAKEIGCDLYITGEISHELYHPIMESKINVLAAGHYLTETFGVSLLAEKLKKETGLETVFIDFPTGL